MAERKTAKPKTFEQMLARLDEIVRSLEKGDAPLEESLSLYTEGAELIRTCTKAARRGRADRCEAAKGRGRRTGRNILCIGERITMDHFSEYKAIQNEINAALETYFTADCPQKRSFWTPCAILSSPEESASDRCCS